MKDYKNRLDKLERAANAGEVRYIFVWDEEDLPELEPGAKVIRFTWPEDEDKPPDERQVAF